MVKLPEAAATSMLRSQKHKDRVSRFFKHAFESVPTHAQIISTKLISRQSQRSVTFTYQLDGKVVTESFNMGGQKS